MIFDGVAWNQNQGNHIYQAICISAWKLVTAWKRNLDFYLFSNGVYVILRKIYKEGLSLFPSLCVNSKQFFTTTGCELLRDRSPWRLDYLDRNESHSRIWRQFSSQEPQEAHGWTRGNRGVFTRHGGSHSSYSSWTARGYSLRCKKIVITDLQH